MPSLGCFKRLKELGKAMVDEVDKRLLGGATPGEIAHYLQDECGVMKDLKIASIKKNLERYRSTELREKVITSVVDANKNKSLSGVTKRLSAMDELHDMVVIQRDRFQKAYTKEANLPGGITLKVVSDEARLLKEMLVELGKLQLETGVLQRAPKKVTGTMMDEAGNVRSFEWSEEQDKLFKQLEGIEYQTIEDLPNAIEGANAPA
jgi:hypothetical protein